MIVKIHACGLCAGRFLSVLVMWTLFFGALQATASHIEYSVEDVLTRSALIAHVRVVGKLELGSETRLHLIEILASARGPAKGQLAMIAFDSSDDASPKWKAGQQLLLFAERQDDGLLHPLQHAQAIVPVENNGRVAASPIVHRLVSPSTLPTADAVISQLAVACQARQIHLQVRLNQDDVRNYDPDLPMRVEIEIENVGDVIMRFENRIEYECHEHHFGRERLVRQLRQQSSAPTPKLCLQRLELSRLQDAMKMAERLSETISIEPGQRAIGEYDLNEEYDLQGGGKFLVWAELGGQRSPAVVLDLPERDEALEELAKLAELDERGPFHLQPAARSAKRMPAVGPTIEGAAIEAALAYWLHKIHSREASTSPAEVVILRTVNIPTDFAPQIDRVHVALSDLTWRNDGEPIQLQTSAGPAIFRWRTLRIRSVEVQGNRATVEIIENDRHNLGGMGGAIELHRPQGRWQVAGPFRLWQS